MFPSPLQREEPTDESQSLHHHEGRDFLPHPKLTLSGPVKDDTDQSGSRGHTECFPVGRRGRGGKTRLTESTELDTKETGAVESNVQGSHKILVSLTYPNFGKLSKDLLHLTTR